MQRVACRQSVLVCTGTHLARLLRFARSVSSVKSVSQTVGDEDRNPEPIITTRAQPDEAEPPSAFKPILPSAASVLHVSLQPDSSVYARPRTIVGRSAGVNVTAALDGGPLKAITRAIAGGPFLLQKLTAVGLPGDAIIAPRGFGQVVVAHLDGTHDLFMRRGAFLAHTDNVKLRSRLQRLSQSGALGITVLRAKGRGSVALSGYGAIAVITLQPNEEYVLSARHIVAWDGSIHTSPVTTPSSFFTRLFLGESTMWKVIGPGKVFVKSRIEPRTGSWFTQRTEPLTPVPKTPAAEGTAVVSKEGESEQRGTADIPSRQA